MLIINSQAADMPLQLGFHRELPVQLGLEIRLACRQNLKLAWQMPGTMGE